MGLLDGLTVLRRFTVGRIVGMSDGTTENDGDTMLLGILPTPKEIIPLIAAI